jgi:hypothetical protein
MALPKLERLRRLVRLFTAGDPVVAAVAATLVVYYCATRGIFQGKASGDGYFGFMYLPGALQHFSFDLNKTVPFWTNILGREATGRVANPCPIGPTLFWLPTYLIGFGLEKLAGLVVKLPSAGQTEFDFWMAGLGSLLAGLGGLSLQFRLLARRLGVGAARFATVGIGLATPIAWYLCNQPLYQHACAFLVVTALVERWDAWRGAMTRRRWALLGALGGAAMLMRLQEGVWLLLPGLDAAAAAIAALAAPRGTGLAGAGKEPQRARDWGALREALIGGALLAAVALVVFAPQLAVWRYFFGHLRPPQPPGHMRWLDPAIVATLFSTRAGLLAWSPILYLSLIGLALGQKRLGPLAPRMALMVLLQLWVNAAAWDHWGSWAYGARRFSDGMVAFGCGLGALWSWLEARGQTPEATRKTLRWRRALAIACGLAVAYNGLLMELVRRQKIKSSGSGAFAAATWIKWAGGPAWLGAALDKVGYPFSQPAGWIFALAHGVPASTFEGVVGNYVPERDCRIHAIFYRPSIEFADPGKLVVEGIAGPPVGKPGAQLVPVGPRVRLLVPLYAAQPVRLTLAGTFGGREAEVRARWDGHPLVAAPKPGSIGFAVPAELVHSRSRVGELELDLPPATQVGKLTVDDRVVQWW